MTAFKIVLTVHEISVSAFVLIYVVKNYFLLFDEKESLSRFSGVLKVPEMIISVLFLGSGIYLITQIPEISNLLIIKVICVLSAIPIAIIGFKRSNKILSVLSLILLFAAYGLALING